MRDLLRFLKYWRKGATAKHPEIRFTRYGLCYNAYLYECAHKNVLVKRKLQERLREEFGEYATYPFDSGMEAYDAASAREDHHLNPVRLAWVDATIADLSAKIKWR